MDMETQWKAIRGRIEGLLAAGQLAVAMFQVKNADDFGVVRKALIPELDALNEELRRFSNQHQTTMSLAAGEALKQYLEKWSSARAGNHTVDLQPLVPLAAFRAEFDYLLRDAEIEGRNLTELAFEHLRRVIAVDSDVQRKWHDAFSEREENSERLGAVHLLSHGIWAFKAVGGGATDLVFGEPLDREATLIRRTARALVLTEWKMVRSPTELDAKAAEARKQCELYVSGVLGDLEMKKTRYIVLVCERGLTAPADVRMRSVTYRHVVLPVAPSTPSREARRGAA